MSILEKVKALPAREPRAGEWRKKYGESYFHLLGLNYGPKEAVSKIAELDGLSEEDETRLYNTAKQWKNK